MNIHADKTQGNKNHVVSKDVAQKEHSILNSNADEPAFQFVDNRPETTTHKQLQKMALNSPQTNQALQLQSIANSQTRSTIQKQGIDEEELLQGKFITIQKQPLEEEELLQGKFKTVQEKGLEEEELLQGKFHTVQTQGIEEEELLQGKFEPIQNQENNTGIPDNLKSGIENLSGYSMDDVQVHYNSDKPEGLQAHAYAQGTDIHVATGQEKHLPHEAWHVVQQKQGRVRPTMQMKGNLNVNEDKGLEKEADIMGISAFNSVISPGVTIIRKKESKLKGILPVLQKTAWMWVNGSWEKQDDNEPQTRAPNRDGKSDYEYVDTGKAEKVDEEVKQKDPFLGKKELTNRTIIDYDSLNAVMDNVEIGVEVSPVIWRKMRQNLSTAITLPNKSHPAHGSNFNKKQRPEQQIKDWAKVISGELKEKLTQYFHIKYQIDLD